MKPFYPNAKAVGFYRLNLKEHSKENIRRAALELFSQFGVDRVSIVDIAKKAGGSQATIYNNFGSKEALAKEFVTAMIDQLVDNAKSVLSPEVPFEEKISRFARFIAGAVAQGRPRNAEQALLSRSIDLQTDPEIKKFLDTTQKKMIELLLEVIQEGKDQGIIHSDISEEAYAIYFNVLMDMFTDPKIHNRRFSEPKLVEDLGNLIINGLK